MSYFSLKVVLNFCWINQNLLKRLELIVLLIEPDLLLVELLAELIDVRSGLSQLSIQAHLGNDYLNCKTNFIDYLLSIKVLMLSSQLSLLRFHVVDLFL